MSPAGQAGGDFRQGGAVGAADEEADFAGAGGQEVGHLREAGEVEVAAYGDGHAVGVGVGVGEAGVEWAGNWGALWAWRMTIRAYPVKFHLDIPAPGR